MSENEERTMRERQIAWDELMSKSDIMEALVSQKTLASNTTARYLHEERRRPENNAIARANGCTERRRLSDALAD